MNIILKRFILGFFILLTCWNIFSLSADTGEESSSVSGGIVDVVVKFIPGMDKYSPEDQEFIKKNIIEVVIRKMAHLEEFTALGFFSMWFMTTFKRTHYQQCLCAEAFGLFCAAFDEIHQLFVPGRARNVSRCII